jgi:tetratricopeptide (TPR) repeat protein
MAERSFGREIFSRPGAFSFAKARSPDDVYALTNLAALELEFDQLDAAEAAYARVLELDPEAMKAYLGLANLQYAQGNYAAALETIASGIAIDDQFAGLYVAKGSNLDMLDRSEEALQAWLRAVELDPRMWQAHGNIASLLVAEGKIEQGISHFEQGLAVLPAGHPAAAQFQELIQAARNSSRQSDLNTDQ